MAHTKKSKPTGLIHGCGWHGAGCTAQSGGAINAGGMLGHTAWHACSPSFFSKGRLWFRIPMTAHR